MERQRINCPLLKITNLRMAKETKHIVFPISEHCSLTNNNIESIQGLNRIYMPILQTKNNRTNPQDSVYQTPRSFIKEWNIKGQFQKS